jgi:hypothetical protein
VTERISMVKVSNNIKTSFALLGITNNTVRNTASVFTELLLVLFCNQSGYITGEKYYSIIYNDI